MEYVAVADASSQISGTVSPSVSIRLALVLTVQLAETAAVV